MSRAFIKEDAGDSDQLPERHQSSSPNYVTPGGLAVLRRRAEELRARLESLAQDSRERREVLRDLRYYGGRLASAILVEAGACPAGEVRFGASVDLEAPDGSRRTVSIVGQDEADESAGKIAWDSSLALKLMGSQVGARVEAEFAGQESVRTVAAIRYLRAP
jgi:transcription elongation GreA/GreB family factor